MQQAIPRITLLLYIPISKKLVYGSHLLNKIPGSSSMLASRTPKTLAGDQKCFNYDGPYNLFLCQRNATSTSSQEKP